MRNILEDERTPLLYLEVNLGHNVVSKLVVFEGDNPMTVVDQFAIANKLSEEKKKKLAKVVQDQLAAILPRIEESEEDNHDSVLANPAKKNSQ